jgi:hypothetical protein
VLAKLPATHCSPSPVAASDWSIQPRTVTASVSAGRTTVTILGGDQSTLADGAFVTGSGIPRDTTIVSGAGTASWVLSKAPATNGTESLTGSG